MSAIEASARTRVDAGEPAVRAPSSAQSGDAVPLHSLPPGTTATVATLTGDAALRWRMLDLGLVSGTPVSVLRRSPLGDPTLYGFRGTMVALRRADAANILVRSLDAPSAGSSDSGKEDRAL